MPSAARDFASVNLASILRSVTATLSQDGTEHSLASEQFDRLVSEKKFAVAVTKVSGVKGRTRRASRYRARNHLAHAAATENAKRRGLSRRQFLISSCGAASTLLNAAHGRTGGFYHLSPEAALDEQLAHEACQTGLDLTQPISIDDWILLQVTRAAVAGSVQPLDAVIAAVEPLFATGQRAVRRAWALRLNVATARAPRQSMWE